MSRPLLTSLAVLGVLLAAVSAAPALETHVLRTGQSSGVPGICGDADDSFTYLSNPACAQAVLPGAFTAADFTAAQTGPAASVITPISAWGQALNCDADARWINSAIEPGSCLGAAESALYACPFVVAEPCNPTATIEVCWMADDNIGDINFGGANPVGVYVNGTPLNSSFEGGSYSTETTASQSGVPVNTGLNWLYVYQRDAGCAVSGLIFSATITIHPCVVSVEPGTWGRVKSLYR
jgi:hypothetical protein